MKICAYTIADNNNLKYLEMMKNSLRKFHSEEELPLIEVIGTALTGALERDKDFFYRATPVIASQLMNDYDIVIKIDADSVITGSLNEAWEGEDWDVKLVLNSNPRENKTYPVSVWDLHPIYEYVNCGFVSMKSKEFVEHWHKLCYTQHFFSYQMREQDLLNILVHYGNYKTQLLDNGDSFWGLASKQYWPDIKLKDKELVLPQNDEWNKIDKKIKVIHFAGGNTPNKMNFNTKFQPEVATYLKELTK